MPTVGENVAQWNSEYGWPGGGDEWSHPWGSSDMMWWGSLWPRVHAFSRGGSTLEIAPGFGRWTRFLKDVSDRLTVVDLSERCIDACRQRFADADNITYHVNDGRSLEAVPDRSIDFAFSFDSLVHVEHDVMAAYLGELKKKLTQDGVAVLHHSNAGAYRGRAAVVRRIPHPVRRRLVARGLCVNVYGWRAESVTADRIAECATEIGLSCVSQELINWQYGNHLIDCISVFTLEGSRWSREPVRVVNRGFMRDASALGRLRPLYDVGAFASSRRAGAASEHD